MAVRRAGIYGGTFDPVHNGHVEVARRVLQLFELDQVMFVPAYLPPHKRSRKLTSAFHRFAMLALATEADQRLLVSTVELDAPDRPYAVNTVERMRESFGDETELFFIVGADSWLEITTWKEWERLLTLCHLIVVTRPGFDLESFDRAKIPATVIDATRSAGHEQMDLSTISGEPRVMLTDVAMVDISATEIRDTARATEFEKLRTMVPPAVAAYIDKHRLYTD